MTDPDVIAPVTLRDGGRRTAGRAGEGKDPAPLLRRPGFVTAAASAAVLGFRALPTSEQAARLADMAARALREWSLDGARIELVKYRENAVFSVRAADGSRYAMRVHRPGYRSDAHIRSEIAWMRALAEAGVRTPEVVDTRDGDVLARVEAVGVPEPRYCDLSRWIDGAQLGRLEDGVAGDPARGRGVVPHDRTHRGRRARARRALVATRCMVATGVGRGVTRR